MTWATRTGYSSCVSDAGERSRSRAFRVEGDIPVGIVEEGGELRCTALNLSRTGMLLVGLPSWPAEPVFSVVIRTPGGDLHAGLRVRAVRTVPVPDGSETQLAVEFLEMSASERQALEFLLQRLLEGRSSAPGRLPEIPPGTPPHEARKILDTVPMPHRIAVAARGGPKERESLLHDQNPQVLDTLARNPMLTSEEARVLASLPLILPNTLATLAHDERWLRDEEVRVAIVGNPRVPFPVAEKVMDTLSAAAKRRALLKPSIHPLVRTALLHRIPR